MPDWLVLVLFAVSVGLSVAGLLLQHRAARTWRAAAIGWERSAGRWREIAERRGDVLDELLGHRP